MKINKAMNLGYLAECMGSVATTEDAANMLDILLAAGFDGAPVDNVPDELWREFMHTACEQYDINYCDYLESVPVPARVVR